MRVIFTVVGTQIPPDIYIAYNILIMRGMMNFFLKKSFCFISLLTALLLPGAENKIMPVAFVGDPPPEVDGTMERMAQLAGQVTRTPAKNIYAGAKDCRNAADLSGKMVLGYDNAYLYIAADVTDDKIEQSHYGMDIWKGDHVMLALQYPYTSRRDNKNIWCLIFSPGNFSNVAAEAVIFTPVNKDPSGIRIAAKRTDRGYKLEAAIPWSILGKAPKKHDRLRFDLLLGDADGAGQETTLSASSLQSRGKPWNPGRIMEGVFAGADGSFEQNSLAQDTLFSSELYTLNVKKNKVTFTLPPEIAGKAQTLLLRAALEGKKKTFHGGTRIMQIKLDGKRLTAADCLNRDKFIQFGRSNLGIAGAMDKWFVTYGNIAGKNYPEFYSAATVIDPCEYVFDIKGKKTLEIIYTPLKNYDLKCSFKLSGHAFQPIRSTLKDAPKGELAFIEPDVPDKVAYQTELTGSGGVKIKLNDSTHVLTSDFSTLKPAWAKFGSQGDGKVAVKAQTAELTARDFKVVRTVEKLSDRIIVRDRITNLTNKDLPVMYKHNIRVAGTRKSWVCGYPRMGKKLLSREPAHPAVMAVSKKGGIGLAAGDDITQVHSKWYSSDDLIGMSNEHLVLTPKREIEIALEIYPLERADYWLFINRIRKAWNVNFAIPGPGGFFSTRTRDSEKILKKRMDSCNYTIAVLSVPFDYGALGQKGGMARHGTKYAQTDVSFWDKTIAKLKAVNPQIKVLPYFHCFISNGKGDQEKYADAMLIDAAGKHADYRGGLYPLYVPYSGSKFAAAQDELLELRFKHGADAIYWDEMEYSKLLFSYSDKYWDNVSGAIDTRTHRLKRKISCVPLLTEEWRVKTAEKLIKRGNGLLIGNGSPFTRKMRKIKTIRFVETASISNLTRSLLYTPISLGDHLTVRNSIDAYKDMVKALDYGCLYYFYRHTYGDYPTLTGKMYPTTPIALGKGYIIGKERILTNISGNFGWGDNSKFVVHIFDRTGKEDTKYKVPVVERNNKRYAQIRIPEGYSAAVIRQ